MQKFRKQPYRKQQPSKPKRGTRPGEAQRCALEKKALQGLARCVRGYTMQEVKRTYEPDPEGGRRLKSEVVTRRTVAPDLDAILFALTNLNPDRWQAKPAPGPAREKRSRQNQPGTQRHEHSPHPGRTAGRRRAGDDTPVDLSTLSDAALAELSALPEWRAAMPAAETKPQAEAGLNSSPDPHDERNLSRKHPAAARLRRDLPGYRPGAELRPPSTRSGRPL